MNIASTTPATQQPADSVRVGDHERGKVISRLGEAFTQGYLSIPEYETRLNQALEAQTAGVLNQVLSDLPVRRIVRTDPQRRATRSAIARRGLQIHLIAYLAASAVMIGIWLTLAITAGAWYFWPVWPILGAGIGLFSHAMAIRCSVRNADRSKR